MKWKYTERYVDISIPVYIKKALHQFGHKTPKNPQHHPYPPPEWTYDADDKKMKLLDTSPSLLSERVKRIECIIGKFLYYAMGVDNMLLFPLITMATINDPTKLYEKNIHQFLITWEHIQMQWSEFKLQT